MKLSLILFSLLSSSALLFAIKPENIPYTDSVPAPSLSEVKYGDHERNVIDLWKAESDSPTPLVLVIHGGGWHGGHKEWIDRFVNVPELLDAGISVAAIEYRLMKHSKDVSPPVKAPLSDATRALQFIRSKASDWNLNPDKIGLTGGSAGACTSLWIAFHDDLANPKSEDAVERESSRPTCAAVHVAQTSLDPKQVLEWTPNMKYGGHAFGKFPLEKYIADRDEILPWIKEYSPYYLLTKDDPPVLLTYNDHPEKGVEKKDPTHSANYGAILEEKSKKIGADCEYLYDASLGKRLDAATKYLIKKLNSN